MSTLTQKRSLTNHQIFILGLLVTGLVTSLASWAVWSLELKWAVFTVLGLLFPFAMAMMRDVRRTVMGLLVFAIPLNADYHFVLHPSPGGANGITLGLTDVLLIILMVQTVLYGPTVKRAGFFRFFPVMTLPALALMVMSAVSLVGARDMAWGLFDLVNMFKAWLFFIVLANNIRDEKDLNFVLKIFFLGLAIQAAIISLQSLLDRSLNLSRFGLGEPADVLAFEMEAADVARPGGTIGHCNHLARYIGMLLPIAMIMALTHPQKSMRRLAVLTSVAGLVGLILTLTRSSWIALVVSLMVMVPFMFSRRLMNMRTIAMGMAAGLVLVALVVVFSDVIWGRLTADDLGSARTRITTAKVALRIIADHPFFGVGINNYGSVLEQYWSIEDTFTRRAAVHNTYLLYASEIGLLGFGAFLWLLVAFVNRIIKASRSHSRFLAAVAVGILGSFAGFALAALTDKGYKESFPLLLTFWAQAAMLEAIIRINQNHENLALELWKNWRLLNDS